jgi:cysteine-rich repeat protein
MGNRPRAPRRNQSLLAACVSLILRGTGTDLAECLAMQKIMLVLAASLVGGCVDDSDVESVVTSSASVDGAIYTSLFDGSRVNANIYQLKADVYLDGGPGPNAPSSAGALPAGDYCFQVTEPPGKSLLSTDPDTCRRFTVSNDGVIVSVAISGGCAHATGNDLDYGVPPNNLGAITVQLIPYSDTPNNGGEYKAWVTPLVNGVCDFTSSATKTDNFKVRGLPKCGDGKLDAGEECDDGNAINGDGCSVSCRCEAVH